jgi:hypothetical protein
MDAHTQSEEVDLVRRAASRIMAHETDVRNQVEAMCHRYVGSHAQFESDLSGPRPGIGAEGVGDDPSAAPRQNVPGIVEDVLQARPDPRASGVVTQVTQPLSQLNEWR